ncbi:glucan 1,4-alpha-glucosidase [Haloferax sp. MBLA0076]|uniref:Glucan 1,4-alpha-glucosidase n=1 Tax=Haloferax litoreum TaxID=2666140 RepID=A0A6A8GCD3_9EURY|nr:MULTISPECIES: glucan 1,4-alpha-glucosidase [Haloferax]KAB1192378.1 glucan 1,4-alpha-glucosidase [Haloferax sp. CBA1148]MRX20843.1 glucan 1,4-alpha-glucosidase [Haloferax litoreum]
MQLRDALADYKRHAEHPTRFPGERRTTSGLFSGLGGRLVHVERDGSLRDFGYPLSGRWGVERSRFGVRSVGDDTGVVWFDDGATQSYVGDGGLVVTEHETCYGDVTQYDLTLDDAHVTRFETDADVELVSFVHFHPDGRDTLVGQLLHGDAVEAYHADEHDFLASHPTFEHVEGRVPEQFDELLSDAEVELPRPLSDDRYEEGQLSGAVVATTPFESGAATVGTLLTDETETDRDAALDTIRSLVTLGREALESRAAEQAVGSVPTHDEAGAMRDDVRVLSLLSGALGLRIAGPDFDPYYAYSGGYGYTWFRDDAEISQFLFESDEKLGLGLDTWHERSARAYCETQRDDGSWPHRVWPFDGSLAPGWANARLESGDDADYQADQTGSVIAFLATYYDDCDDPDLRADIEETLTLALDSLDETLGDDGLPIDCQNAWENMTGRFSHTTATFLEAYAALALSGLDSDLTDRAAARAREVYEGVDALWSDERDCYALRLVGDELDDRYDSAALALVSAHRTYDELESVDGDRLDRLVRHVESVFDGLWHDPDESDVKGLVRFEGDDWRMREQSTEKIWTVSTAWGANAAVELAALLADHDDERRSSFVDEGTSLLSLVLPDGPLCTDEGYLAEQFFDDGTPDSATPLGWPHALRLATVATLTDEGML